MFILMQIKLLEVITSVNASSSTASSRSSSIQLTESKFIKLPEKTTLAISDTKNQGSKVN
jgi:hypothetical protein